MIWLPEAGSRSSRSISSQSGWSGSLAWICCIIWLRKGADLDHTFYEPEEVLYSPYDQLCEARSSSFTKPPKKWCHKSNYELAYSQFILSQVVPSFIATSLRWRKFWRSIIRERKKWVEVTFAAKGRLVFSNSFRIFWYLPQKQDIHLVKATYNRQFNQRGKIQ